MDYKCKYHNNQFFVEKSSTETVTIKGALYDGAFHPYPEDLAAKGINEQELKDYVTKNPMCSDIKLEFD